MDIRFLCFSFLFFSLLVYKSHPDKFIIDYPIDNIDNISTNIHTKINESKKRILSIKNHIIEILLNHPMTIN